MPKSKNKPNAFSAYCHEWRKKQEKLGCFFTLQQAINNPDCIKAWTYLPEEQKTQYKTIAKKTNYETVVDRKTGLGESLNAIEQAEIKKRKFMDDMKDYISEATMSAKECNSIQKLTFYLIHTNYMYNRTLDNNEVEYYPAEICLARCSLENGIDDVYHVLISDEVLKGYRSDAVSHSKETHQIPIQFAEGTNDYKEIYKNLCKFLEPGRKNSRLPPIYTLMQKEDVYYPAKSILGKLCAANNEYEEYLCLYSFEELFASMYNAVIDQTGAIDFESITALRELKKDPYAYKHGLECDYHETLNVGALHCSQSIIKRWFYVLCDFCCDPLEIIKVQGVHVPLEKSEFIPQLSRLNSTFSTLSLNDSRYNSTLNMTEVSNDYKMRSRKSVQEEFRRKDEAKAKPFQIIDHSKINRKIPEVKERPLRLPHSKPSLLMNDDDTSETGSTDCSEAFPAIGRGAVPKKRTQEKKSSAGHGALKSQLHG